MVARPSENDDKLAPWVSVPTSLESIKLCQYGSSDIVLVVPSDRLEIDHVVDTTASRAGNTNRT